jgi:hypothetical protein
LDHVQRVTLKDWGQLSVNDRSFADGLLSFSRKEITLIDLGRSSSNDQGSPHTDDVGGYKVDNKESHIKSERNNADQGFLGRTLITFDALKGIVTYIVRTPLGPIALSLVLLMAFSYITAYTSARTDRIITTINSGLVIAYSAFLIVVYLRKAARMGGFSVALILNLILLALTSVFAMIVLIDASKYLLATAPP